MLEKEKRNQIFIIFFGLLLFVITYQVVMGNLALGYGDYNYHAETAEILKKYGLRTLLKEIGYPFWAICVGIVSAVSRAPVYEASAIVTGGLNTITYVIVYYFLSKDDREVHPWIALLSFMILLVGPFYIPWYNEKIFLGQGHPNVWHNPGAICVRPFAIIVFLLILDLLEKYENEEGIEKKKWFFLAGTLILCNLAKPSFMQIVVPGLGLYLIFLFIKTKGKSLVFSIKMVLSFVPGVCLLFGQALIAFISSDMADGGIGIALFAVMKLNAPNVFVSMMLGYLFPAYVLISNVRILRERDVRLTLCIWLSAFLEAALFVETGARFADGNFTWGHLLAMFFVYLVAFKYFLKYNRDYDYNNKKELGIVIIGWIIFVLQFFIGVYYIYTLLAYGLTC